jgi:IS30 family transposase
MIDKRPDYINLRSRIGRWEIDAAISKEKQSGNNGFSRKANEICDNKETESKNRILHA